MATDETTGYLAMKEQFAQQNARLDAIEKRVADIQHRLKWLDGVILRSAPLSSEIGNAPMARPPLDRAELAAKLHEQRYHAQGVYLSKNECQDIIAFLAEEGALRD